MADRKSNGSARKSSGRIDAPVGKAQWIDKEEGTKSGRIDHPEGKQQWMDKENEEPKNHRVDQPGRPVTSPNTGGKVERPKNTGQTVTRPSTSSQQPAITDNSTVNTYFTVKVTEAGKKAEEVTDLVMGKTWRTRGINPAGGYSIQSNEEQAMNIARKALSLGAKVEVTKTVRIDIRLI